MSLGTNLARRVLSRIVRNEQRVANGTPGRCLRIHLRNDFNEGKHVQTPPPCSICHSLVVSH